MTHRLGFLPAVVCEYREPNDEVTLIDVMPSVCIISIVRLIVLSRLEEFDVTCECPFLRTFLIKLIGRHLGNYVDAAIWSAAEPAMGQDV